MSEGGGSGANRGPGRPAGARVLGDLLDAAWRLLSDAISVRAWAWAWLLSLIHI